MFYSEAILSKKGPLAKVWLAAHWEKKLSKAQFLQTNIEKSVGAIVDQGQGPMALRMTGQLLLGVVRIYSRKARYLLDDCNEALLKIKMAFRPANVDMISTDGKSAKQQAAQITLPETIGELDLLNQDFNLSFDLGKDLGALQRQPTDMGIDMGFDTSIEVGRAAPSQSQRIQFEESDLLTQPLENDNLDLGIDIAEPEQDLSIEVGRDAAPARDIMDEFASPQGKPMDDLERANDETRQQDVLLDEDLGIDLQPDVSMQLGSDINNVYEYAQEDLPTERARSQSREPSLNISLARDSPERQSPEQQRTAKRARSKKAVMDSVTELSGAQVKAQLEDTSSITRPQIFMPRDPRLLSLQEQIQRGGFLNSIFGNQDVHPALAEFTNIEAVRRRALQSSNEKKRRPIEEPGAEPSPKQIRSSPVPEETDGAMLGQDVPQEQDTFEAGELQADPMLEAADNQESVDLPEIARSSPQPIEAETIDQPATSLQEQLEKNETFSFLDTTKGMRRADAANLFFDTLAFATKNLVKVNQSHSYGDIVISKA